MFVCLHLASIHNLRFCSLNINFLYLLLHQLLMYIPFFDSENSIAQQEWICGHIYCIYIYKEKKRLFPVKDASKMESQLKVEENNCVSVYMHENTNTIISVSIFCPFFEKNPCIFKVHAWLSKYIHICKNLAIISFLQKSNEIHSI